MQAEAFYQARAEGAIPLVCVTGLDEVKPEHMPAAKLQQFKAQSGECLCVGDAAGEVTAVYVGLGHKAAHEALASVVMHLPAGLYQPTCVLSTRAAVFWALAQYRFDAYKKTSDKPRVLVLDDAAVLAEVSAIFKTRDLINRPANDLGPEALAKAVQDLADTHGATYKDWVGDALISENFPAIYAVGRAAKEAPRLASLTWGNPEHPRISLVGKGVCFDSGGLDIKPSRGMRLMKKDMGGAANAIGLAHWMMSLKLPVYLELLIPAVENAVGSNAYRPGDVITMRNGLTVEIDNTDAEGRLILADALTKACESKPELLFDFSTLTGAARIAVGTDITAMFSNHDELANEVMTEGEQMADPVWRLPLYPGYKRMFSSSIADLSNSAASSYAGAITAALFLEYFVEPGVDWMHCDFMAWNLKSRPGKPEGGEAMGIYAIAEYLIKRYGDAA